MLSHFTMKYHENLYNMFNLVIGETDILTEISSIILLTQNCLIM
jgi:hypothetical protein